MSIFVRLWLAMAVVLLAGAWLTIDLLQEQVKPSVRQAIEETRGGTKDGSGGCRRGSGNSTSRP